MAKARDTDAAPSAPPHCVDCAAPLATVYNSLQVRCSPCQKEARARSRLGFRKGQAWDEEAGRVEQRRKNREYHAANRARLNAKKRVTKPKSPADYQYKPMRCVDCGLERKRTSARQKRCVPCAKSKHARQERLRRAANPEKVATANREYRKKNPDLDKRRYHADPLRYRMSCAVRRALRGHKMGRSWEALVGYTANELRSHLERQFLPRMGWHNYSGWHLDHIVPLREFDCADPEQFKAAWALSNLQPLWGSDNCKKGGKRLTLL